jgi:hypothetical protein
MRGRRAVVVVMVAGWLGWSSSVVHSSGVRITSPSPGATISGGTAVVEGEVPPDAGVTVNEIPGLVEGGRFVALVPVAAATSLTVVARSWSGVVGTDSIGVSVVAAPDAEPMRLTAFPPGGLAPLTVRFRLDSLVGIGQASFDADGDGRPDSQERDVTGVTFTYSRPGIYAPRVEVKDTEGKSRSAATIVQASDRTALDARLQFVWDSFKAALKPGDVARAMEFLHSSTRDRFREQLGRMSPAALANIDRTMTAIRLVEVGFGGAQYEMLRQQDGRTHSFPVWFQLDRDGLWRLRRF